MVDHEPSPGETAPHTAVIPTLDTARLSALVVEAVAVHDQRSPDDLEPIYQSINPDALDSLFTPLTDGTSRADGHVSFAYCGYHVTITSDGTIDLEPLETTPP
ncbi:HalOD1 output domain-containing protein [Haladaptatus salinisoli]|uniref:HalOD1 output domain-containing protein n=1 Tax=Haladaptatus salinisoli TaxID=2884876 RepID=UPI001D0AA499|nr:HalOD1 output domain-containing protein [Haladaptatus salinisoli]